MMQITKALALAVVKAEITDDGYGDPCYCTFCSVYETPPDWKIEHEPGCIVPKAKLLLKLEWGIES